MTAAEMFMTDVVGRPQRRSRTLAVPLALFGVSVLVTGCGSRNTFVPPPPPKVVVAQTAAVFGALAAARGPIDASSIAANFRRTRSLETTIFSVLESLARLGHVSSSDGKTFGIRRLA